MSMYALSIKQPWAAMIVTGQKTVENRVWRTRYRGPLLIHASKRVAIEAVGMYGHPTPAARGCIVGMVWMFDCTRRVTNLWHDRGYYGWYFRNAQWLKEPRPYPGQLRLFEVPDDAVPEIPVMLELIKQGDAT